MGSLPDNRRLTAAADSSAKFPSQLSRQSVTQTASQGHFPSLERFPEGDGELLIRFRIV